jgi:hypothetical protein
LERVRPQGAPVSMMQVLAVDQLQTTTPALRKLQVNFIGR